MVTLGELWLPTVLSAVFVFVASFLMWMVLPHHKTEWKRLPDEGAVAAVLRKQKPAPGEYLIPYCADAREMKNPEMLKKYEEGPVGVLTLRRPRRPDMGAPMALSLIYYLVVSTFVAYLAGRTLGPGVEYLKVFRVAGTSAFLAYGFAHIPHAIWIGRPWSATLKEVGDALVYGLLTAGCFGWLWPR